MAIKFVVQDEAARAYLKKIQQQFLRNKHDPVLRRVAWSSFGRLIRGTPKGWTGNTRQKWSVIPVRGRGYLVTNTNKVMMFLELGTKAHGPVRAKMLYIPLTRSAAIGGWTANLEFGRDYVLAKRVRGIRARRIVQTERPIAMAALRQGMVNFIRRVT